MNSVYFITLGCSKNDVDTSVMKNILDSTKYINANDADTANILIVNTCGFIDSAKEESINAIIKAVDYKKNDTKKIIVAGCLAQRYAEELMKEIPEIDGIIGTGNLSDINDVLDNAIEDKLQIKIDNINNEYIEGSRKKDVNVTEYVKISEGCNNNCTYCIIPRLRGRNRSRKIEDIFKEIKYLVDNGTREVILIAQNTTDYGIDIYKEYKLTELIKEISKIEKLKWIRVLYMYPDNFSDELINEFKNNEKLLNYIDVPLQHVSDNILKRMNRKVSKINISNLLNKLKSNIEDMVIRTTFIVGFPGETEEDFDELKKFIKINEFDKLGVFKYSKEESTAAYYLKNHKTEKTKEKRYNEIMESQNLISERKLAKNKNKIMEVIIEDKLEDDSVYVGRSYMDAPEIDGVIYIKTDKNLNIGDFINVKIIDTLEYDMIGELI